jgi:hypothetical protein
MGSRQSTNEENLFCLTLFYLIGGGLAACILLFVWVEGNPYRTSMTAYAFLYMTWSTLVWASAYLAVEKGRELVEGAVLGAFGPLGFIIEVQLPSRPAEADKGFRSRLGLSCRAGSHGYVVTGRG